MTTDWRTHARDVLRAELAEAATDVFAAEGYEAITVDGLVRRLGVSRATFFRYFSSKEEAVLATLGELSDTYARAVETVDAAASAHDESAWELIGRALRRAVDTVNADSPTTRRRVRMVMQTSALRARFRDDRVAREARLAAALEPVTGGRLAASALACAALGALDAAWREWAEDETEHLTLADAVAEATDALVQAGEQRGRP